MSVISEVLYDDVLRCLGIIGGMVSIFGEGGCKETAFDCLGSVVVA